MPETCELGATSQGECGKSMLKCVSRAQMLVVRAGRRSWPEDWVAAPSLYIYIYMVTPPCMTYRCLSNSRWGPLADNKKVKKHRFLMVFD